jgi:hypothetical protein
VFDGIDTPPHPTGRCVLVADAFSASHLTVSSEHWAPDRVRVMADHQAFEFNLARGAELDIGHAPDRVPNRIGQGDQRVSFRTTQCTRYSVRKTLAPGISGVRRPAQHQAQSRCAYLEVGTDATDWLNPPGTSIRANDVGPRPKFVTISQRAHNTGRPPVTATRAPEI